MNGKGIALAVLLVAATAGAQKRFEGTVTYKVTMPGGHTATSTVAQKGSRIRQEQALPMGRTAATIMNVDTGDVIMLMPALKNYMSMTGKQIQEQSSAPPPDAASVKVTPTGKKDTIAGLACDTYRIESPGSPPVEICAAKGMGTIGMLGSAPGMGSASASSARNPTLQKLEKEGFLPLRTVVLEGPAQGMTTEATKVDRTPPAVSLFAPPADYTRVDPRAAPPGMPPPGMPPPGTPAGGARPQPRAK